MIVEVDRGDLHRSRLHDAPPAELEVGQARLSIDGFALTSNNVTYGAFGDALGYWNFFPAEDPWGRIPVWGFGEVVETRTDAVSLGDRVYGYLPMADELVVTPGRADDRAFYDLADHRQAMASAYNRYLRTSADAMYDGNREGQQMVLRPLFTTSFMIDDLLTDAPVLVLSSASSKTAIGTAFLSSSRVIGLTSPSNAGFVEGLGCYDAVVTYDDIASLPREAAVFVDMAGNRDVVTAVHRHYGDELTASYIVGGTHWDHEAAPSASPRPGPEPQFFFAPTQIATRSQEWGPAVLERRVADAWQRFVEWTDGWLELRQVSGPAEVEATFHELLQGRIDPRLGYVCRVR